jgi:uncharacterized protein (DUF2267 family)
MNYEEIIEVIRRASGGLGHLAAERAAQATLQTLAERLPRGEAGHIQRELSAEFMPWPHTETDAEAFDIDEFLDRVAQREAVDVETALLHARAVFFALGHALSPRVVAHLSGSLPHLHVVKVSFPRPIVQGSLHDRDMHAGQNHVPLASVVLPS